MRYEEVSLKRFEEIAEYMGTGDLVGKFLTKDGDTYVAMDCIGNNYYVEEFKTAIAADAWLNGEIDTLEARELDTFTVDKEESL